MDAMESLNIKFQYLWPTRRYGWLSTFRTVAPITEFDTLAEASSYSVLDWLAEPDGAGAADSFSIVTAGVVAELFAVAGSSSTGLSGTDGGESSIDSPGVSTSTAWATLVADLNADAGSSSTGWAGSDGGDASIGSPGVSTSTVWAQIVADLDADSSSFSTSAIISDGGDASIDSPGVSTSTAWATLVADLTADAGSASSGGAGTDGGDASIDSPGVSTSTAWAQLVADLTADAGSSSTGGAGSDGGDASIDSPGVSTSTAWATLVADLTADAGSSSSGGAGTDGGDASIGSPGVSTSTAWAELVAGLDANSSSFSASTSVSDGGEATIGSPGVSTSTVWATIVPNVTAATSSFSTTTSVSDGGEATIGSPGVSTSTVWATIVPNVNAATSSFSTSLTGVEGQSASGATSFSETQGKVIAVDQPVTASVLSASTVTSAASSVLQALQTVAAAVNSTSTVASTVTAATAITPAATATVNSTSTVASTVTAAVAVTPAVTATVNSTSTVASTVTAATAITPAVTATVNSTSTVASTVTAVATITQAVTAAVRSTSVVSSIAVSSIVLPTDARADSVSTASAAAVIVEPPLPTITGWNHAFFTNADIPAHKPGDLIVVWANRIASVISTTAGYASAIAAQTSHTAPALPTTNGTGTVPLFTTINPNSLNATGSVYTSTTTTISGVTQTYFVCASERIAWARATANNHTAGVWTNSNNFVVAVFDGDSVNSTTPIGGASIQAGTGTSPTSFNTTTLTTAPGITLTDNSERSMILHSQRHITRQSAGSATPTYGLTSGYTVTGPGAGGRFIRKNVSNSAPSVTMPVTFTGITNGSFQPPNTFGHHAARLATIEILAKPSPVTSQTVTESSVVTNKIIEIPAWCAEIDFGALGGGHGGFGNVLPYGQGGQGGVWNTGGFSTTVAALLTAGGVAAGNVASLFARVTVGRGGTGGGNNLLASPTPAGAGTASSIQFVARLSGGGETVLRTVTGNPGPGLVPNVGLTEFWRGAAATGGNLNGGKDVSINGSVWDGGGQNAVPGLAQPGKSYSGNPPGGGGCGAALAVNGFAGAAGLVKMRFKRNITRITGKNVEVTTNDEGETLYDGMTMAEIRELVDQLVEERVAAITDAANAEAAKDTRQQIQEVLDVMNGPDATLDSVKEMFWLLNDLMGALMEATGVELPAGK